MVGALVTTCALANAHESQEDDPSYLDIMVNVTEYDRTGYMDFDLVRMSLDIANRDSWSLNHPTFALGGDSNVTPEGSAGLPKAEYAPVSAEHAWNLNAPVSPNDCAVGNQWGDISAYSTGSVLLCFVVEKSFLPNGLLVGGESGHGTESGSCYSSGSVHYSQHTHYNTEWPVCAIHVVPLQDDSTYCDRYSKYCDRDNTQTIPEWVVLDAPAEVPEHVGANVESILISPAGMAGDPLGPGTLFLASATILAFAVFGSALSMKIPRHPKNKDASWYARVCLPLSILAMIGVQALFMTHLVASVYGLRQLTFWTIESWVFLTILCLIGVTLFATIAKSHPASVAAGTDTS